jgi:plastocyanin
LVLIATLLPGCSSGGHNDVKNRDALTVGRNQPIVFGASEYKFEPKSIVVNSGTTQPTVVRFVVRDNGALAHDLHIEKDGKDLGGTAIFAPGSQASGQATLGPGSYEFICTVGDHAGLGMKGALTVTSKKTTRPVDPDAAKHRPGG